MSQYVDENIYPNSAVVYIEARWGDQRFFGSGFFSGINDVITSAHVIYNDQLGGFADEVKVFPQYDPASSDNFSVQPVFYHYFPNFDEDADGRIPTGDLTWWSYAGSELDIALLTLDLPLGEVFGWYGLDFSFAGGVVNLNGYPGIYGRRQVFDTGIVTRSDLDGVFYLDRQTIDVNPGNSGGPIYYDTFDGPLAVGVISTSIGATEIGAHLSWLPDAITGNNEYLKGLGIIQGSAASDSLIGDNESNFILGFQGNDEISGAGGNDILVGGDGFDAAFFSGNISSYTLRLNSDYCEILDRVSLRDGIDQLVGIERLSFSDYYVDLENFIRVMDLAPEKILELIELYIAYFNRAPDALGLSFWGGLYSSGWDIDSIANIFGISDEAQVTYSLLMTNQEFVERIYDNVLGRLPDMEGLEFWVDVLNEGKVAKELMILGILNGVSEDSTDKRYLEHKVDIGAYFSVIKGISDSGMGAFVMQLYDGTDQSVDTAVNAIDSAFQSALDPNTGQFLFHFVGLLNDPFIM